MPRTPRTSEPADVSPEATTTESAPPMSRGSKTAAIRAALKAHPKKLPKELAALMQAEGWDVSAQSISVVKSALKLRKKTKKAASGPTPEAEAAAPRDAVSIGLLRRAKKLVQELGGIQEAKTALNALAQLLD